MNGLTRAASEYIQTVPEEWLLCREGRHRYADVPLSQIRFHTNSLGEDVFTNPCERCGEAYQEKRYIFHTDSKGRVLRVEYLGATTKYYPPEGETGYLLPPGSGYVGGRVMHEERIGSFMKGRVVRREERAGGTIAKRGLQAS